MATAPADFTAPPGVRTASGLARTPRAAAWLALAAIAAGLLVWFIAPRHAPHGGRQNGVAHHAGPGIVAPEIAAVIAEPQAFKPLTTSDALAENAARPLAARPLEVAPPFVLTGDQANWDKAANCLALANYYEAASEGDAGMRAVSQVVLNRMRHPAFPHSVCDVVFQGAERPTGCQFTFTCDGSLRRPPVAALLARARRVAEEALRGRVEVSVGMATHYHANFVVPYWADSLDKLRTVGSHIFYVWRGSPGNRAAFRGIYAGEPAELAFPGLADGADAAVAPDAEGTSALALAAERITLGSKTRDGTPPQRTYLVADEAARSLKADDDDNTGTLRAQPLLARTPDAVLSDGR